MQASSGGLHFRFCPFDTASVPSCYFVGRVLQDNPSPGTQPTNKAIKARTKPAVPMPFVLRPPCWLIKTCWYPCGSE